MAQISDCSCGEKNMKTEKVKDKNKNEFYLVKCKKCGKQSAKIQRSDEKSEKKAIGFWNKLTKKQHQFQQRKEKQNENTNRLR